MCVRVRTVYESESESESERERERERERALTLLMKRDRCPRALSDHPVPILSYPTETTSFQTQANVCAHNTLIVHTHSHTLLSQPMNLGRALVL